MYKSKEERRQAFVNYMPFEFRYLVTELDDLGFFTVPASIKFHGAYTGGLYDHSELVAQALVNLTEKLGLTWERPESPYIVGMLHDLCKLDNYKSVPNDVFKEWTYSDDVIDPDHGSKSVILIQKMIKLTDEEIACVRWHMGAYETDPKMWNYYGRAIDRYPNVLYTHTADMIASHILGV